MHVNAINLMSAESLNSFCCKVHGRCEGVELKLSYIEWYA